MGLDGLVQRQDAGLGRRKRCLQLVDPGSQGLVSRRIALQPVFPAGRFGGTIKRICRSASLLLPGATCTRLPGLGGFGRTLGETVAAALALPGLVAAGAESTTPVVCVAAADRIFRFGGVHRLLATGVVLIEMGFVGFRVPVSARLRSGGVDHVCAAFRGFQNLEKIWKFNWLARLYEKLLG